jgi:hypothetical protein
MSRLEEMEGYAEAMADEALVEDRERREHRKRVELAILNVRGFAGAGEVRKALLAMLTLIS